MSGKPRVAYFSMEIGLEPSIPTYSGGLGVLAGDTLRSAADLGLPLVAVTLAHRAGYFNQHLDSGGNQTESDSSWRPEERLDPLHATVAVEIEGRTVRVRGWRYVVRGISQQEVPVILLDTALPENEERDRTLTDRLYGGDHAYRLAQEIILGMGGAAMLDALGYGEGLQYHINEGHAALLCLWLLTRQAENGVTVDDVEAVARRCVFTTHTPVPAGHDKFDAGLSRRMLGDRLANMLDAASLWHEGYLNMTYLALRCSRFINAVALRHKEVSEEMFPGFPIGAITNGVHAVTWTAEPFRELFDRCLPGWRHDNDYLRYAVTIPLDEIRQAHAKAKAALIDEVERRSGVRLDRGQMTIGFARRSATYKRADLIFTDVERLRAVTRNTGPIQLVFAGKAHPHDGFGKEIIKRIFAAAGQLGDALRVVYLQNYDMRLGEVLTSGTDLWLNNPIRPLEASGTSGMKAALNGVPSLSVLDGWWVEGCIEGVTGWAIGGDASLPQDPSADIPDLYAKLERVVIPLFYGLPYRYAEVMRNAIALNGSYYNTQRMVTQYLRNAYFPGEAAEPATVVAAG